MSNQTITMACTYDLARVCVFAQQAVEKLLPPKIPGTPVGSTTGRFQRSFLKELARSQQGWQFIVQIVQRSNATHS